MKLLLPHSDLNFTFPFLHRTTVQPARDWRNDWIVRLCDSSSTSIELFHNEQRNLPNAAWMFIQPRGKVETSRWASQLKPFYNVHKILKRLWNIWLDVLFKLQRMIQFIKSDEWNRYLQREQLNVWSNYINWRLLSPSISFKWKMTCMNRLKQV